MISRTMDTMNVSLCDQDGILENTLEKIVVGLST